MVHQLPSGGSGGIGAAVSAARAGADTVLIERNQMLGGTSTMAWVHSWEPSVGGGGLPRELFERMRADALGCQQVDYRHGEPRVGGSWLAFEPYCLNREALRMALEAGVDVRFSTTFMDAELDLGRISRTIATGPWSAGCAATTHPGARAVTHTRCLRRMANP